MILGSPPEKLLWTAAAPGCAAYSKGLFSGAFLSNKSLEIEKQEFHQILNLPGQSTSQKTDEFTINYIAQTHSWGESILNNNHALEPSPAGSNFAVASRRHRSASW